MFLKDTKFLVVGISRSGIAVLEFLLSHKSKCYMWDDKIEYLSSEVTSSYEKRGVVKAERVRLVEIVKEVDVVVLSPGVPIDSEVALLAKKHAKRIIGELELGSLFSSCPIVAVTGTNGKTTTCTLISSMLTNAKVKNCLVGNIGIPFTSKINEMNEETVAVTEVSSFQLETIQFLRPHIAVVTNISEDHLSRHYNMQNYVYLKSKILHNLRESEYAVLNYDDNIVKGFAEKTRGKIIYFSCKEKVDGVYLEDGMIYYFDQAVLDIRLLSVRGEHNVANILAAVAVGKILGVEDEMIAETVVAFRGIKHRVEFIGNIGGIEYVNDSKSTNVDSTIKAIQSISRPIVLMLGGKDKGQSFDELFRYFSNSNVVKIILYGQTRYKMLKSAERGNVTNYCVATNLTSAVALARAEAKSGDCVLLSPACASYDEFSGYEERGECFIKAVKSLE